MVDQRFVFDLWGKQSMTQLYPLWMLKYLPNMVACHIGIAQDAQGPNNTITLGEASSLLAVMEGASIIERGAADVMIVGGAGSRLNLTPMLYRGDLNLSHRADDPAAASRPFDRLRDGMVNGEGSGAFVLESREFAQRRGARPLARILGFGRSYEVLGNGRAPTGHGVRNSIVAALRSSGRQPVDIGHVNAHGISTVAGDRLEAQAIRATLGEVPVTAPKSFFGNLGAGGGAVEMAASVLGLQTGEVPRTLNYEEPDPDCPIAVVHGQSLMTEQRVALILNQSGTGQTAALVVGAA
jgi:3-oxoacyl-[acyl-carrier-protein] synthase II